MDRENGTSDPSFRDGYRQGFEDGRKADDKHDDEEAHGKEPNDKETKGDAADAKRGKMPLYKRPGIVAAALLVLLALIIGGILYWRHSRRHETTDDAFVDGYTSQMAAQTSGRVVKLYVVDNQLVGKGQPLLDIDSRDTEAREAQARGQLASAKAQYEQASSQIYVAAANADEADASVREAEAQWRKAAADLQRYREVDPAAVPKQEVDAAVSNERTARAKLDAARMTARGAHAQVHAAEASSMAARSQIESSQATLDAAELQSGYTHVTAPISGRVARRTVDVGNVISTGQPLLALVSESLWITANFKETQLTRMQIGQPVSIVVDAFPKVAFRGRIDSIQNATGAYFSSLPAENATGNYVKVVQRVPVKITFADDSYRRYPIGPGMSVTPDVTVR
ncbi:MAG TPA: HlyD family secretion protein [Steroidobacteraceae bacterium]|jgi:membrane fusion protein (multidrug efflux system)|nr:HlyD family secretion protein [Steroidobacteraceae bacterium]